MPDPPKPGEDGWVLTAWCTDDLPEGPVKVVMGLRRVWADPTKAPVVGVQFHPESFMTVAGYHLLANFLRMGSRPRSPIDTVSLQQAATHTLT